MIWILDLIFLFFLVVCAIEVIRTKDLLAATVIFSAYSMVMSIIWQQLNAPDVAITEAAVGAGITTMLFVATISKTTRWEEE
ncbi:MAG: hydrogenase subunit MbhD domain-containing protein [Candidatus Hydrothermarchaeales archaeon]